MELELLSAWYKKNNIRHVIPAMSSARLLLYGLLCLGISKYNIVYVIYIGIGLAIECKLLHNIQVQNSQKTE